MRVDYNDPRVVAGLKGAPANVRRAFYKQAPRPRSPAHPSLRAKKFDQTQNLWQARVNKDWRFYFIINGDVCIVLDVIPHPK
jgi:hypothetical protein